MTSPLACSEIGARLFQARRKAGLGIIKLGKLSGVSHTTINDIEKGRRMPAIDTVERLARTLKVRPEWLAYGVRELECREGILTLEVSEQ